MPLLIIWLTINAMVAVVWITKVFGINDWSSIFLYPEIHERLDCEEVGLGGKIFIDALFTIILLPAIIIYFALVFVVLILALILYIIQLLFIRIFGKK
jgi:hypothetical protein